MGVYVMKMPDIGEGIAEVELVAWHVKEGDAVADDQVLADVMTDKATVQVPSPTHGKVLSLGGSVGEVMAVGSTLIQLEVEGPGNIGEDGDPQAAAPAAITAASAAPTAASVASTAESAATTAESAATAAESAAADARTLRQHALGRPLASPSVRRRAREQGVDLRAVPATGPVGQITQEDLNAWLERGGTQDEPGVGMQASHPSYALRDGVEEIPVVGLRRRIAQKMQEAVHHIPHFTYVEEVDVTELETLRATLNDRWQGKRERLTLVPFLVRAIVLALGDFPQMNARYDDDKGIVLRHAAVHLGVAVQTDGGLVVPVLRHAETLDLWACAAQIRRLAQAAREGSAQRDELSGSTISLTSLGGLGGIVSTPIINHPEVAIVGVNRIVERPAVLDGAIVVRKMMNLSSSFDHRIVDGMHAAGFIQHIRQVLECPVLLFVE